MKTNMFTNEQLKNSKDRAKLKSKFFSVDNVYINSDGSTKHVEAKPFINTKVDRILIYSNLVMFRKNGISIDEIKNVGMDTNSELASIIEDRI